MLEIEINCSKILFVDHLIIRKNSYIKRFQVETSSLNSKFEFLPNNHRSTTLLFASVHPNPKVSFEVKDKKGKVIENELETNSITDVMGWKALGSKLSDFKVSKLKDISPALIVPEKTEEKASSETTSIENKDQDQPKLFWLIHNMIFLHHKT